MITVKNLELTSRADGLKLGATVVSPENPKGVLQISHGMSEHRERYLDFQQFLAENGWASVIHDHRGHGESVRSDEDLGYFYKQGAESIVADLHQVTGFVRAKFPNLPLVLLGHSMGSLIARIYCKKYDRDIDGLIVCGSPSKNEFAPVAKNGVRILKKGRHRPAVVQKLAFGTFSKRFAEQDAPNPFSENNWICSDPEVVKTYDADEKCGFVFTSNGFFNLFKLMQNCYSSSGWKVRHPELPVFFISGADDPCLISEKSFHRAVKFLTDRGYAETKYKLYPGMRHEILNETGKREVYGDVLAFCEGVAQGAKV